ncbi:MAG: hypothetical protein F4045_13565 [Chloroflexi bacterium]|nr:hypothetical protein [Chloroflexota bacterium]MXY59915.1 hypothetical protein [Chloroflexota bacterium]MYA50876.1 hypothetical protein [Chloroflexota bacterium]MYB84087.1 hypothetical protein [Chloroflexota bacterium]MYK36088.1 hypothetical protein [Chloroflexota bacterium]
MKDKQLDAASFVGRAATMVALGFFVERVGTAYFGAVWGAVIAIGVMLAILAGIVLWPRLNSKGSEEEQAGSPGEAAGP